MINVIGVSFGTDKTINLVKSNSIEVKRGVTVIVKTDRGLLFGQVVLTNYNVEKIEKENELIRISTKKDYQKHLKNIEEKDEAIIFCNELIKKHKLPMKIIDAEYTFDKNQLMFRFVSDTRVDFRELAKELANFYKTRIELRQIGIRDKAKEVGGYGSCGQKLCCARFNTDFSAVSINMAKNQGLSLNPSKINGVCGRLLCCLKYEDDNYKECRKSLPKLGAIVQTEKGTGKVISIDVLKKTYKVLSNGEVTEIKACCGSN